MRYFLACGLFVSLTACQSANLKTADYSYGVNLPIVVASDLQIQNVAFGSAVEENHDVVFKPGFVISKKAGTKYLWVIQLETTRKDAKVREELILPGAGKWSTDPTTVVSEDRRRGVTQKIIPIDHGQITNIWEVDNDDPAGDYEIRVWVEGAPAADFHFRVQ